MGTIADKLTYLGETKSDLRATLNGLLGLSLDANTPFRRYAYEADMAAMRGMFASGELGGYWEPTLSSYYEDSTGRYAASVNGVVGLWLDKSKSDPVVRRNILTDSNDFTKSTWTKYKLLEVSVVPEVSNPLGGNVYKIIEDSSNDLHAIYSGTSFTLAPNTTFTFSVYVKPMSRRYVRLYTGNTSGFVGGTAAVFDLQTKTVVSGAGYISIENDDWVRISVQFLVGNAQVFSTINMLTTPSASSNIFQGDGQIGIYLANAQFEIGPVATEYQPITTNAEFAAANWANNIQAIQATTANKPYLRKTPQTNRYWLDGNATVCNLTATWGSSLGSNCTIARLDPELGVQWSEAQTIGTTFNLITPYAYHGPMLIINRALTAAEKAVVGRVMNRFMPQLGPELMTNGDFDQPLSGWVPLDGVTASTENGRLKIVSTGAGGVESPNITVAKTIGLLAKIDYVEGTMITNLWLGVFGGRGSYGVTTPSSTLRTQRHVFIPFAGVVSLYPRNGAAGTTYFDNASLRSIL